MLLDWLKVDRTIRAIGMCWYSIVHSKVDLQNMKITITWLGQESKPSGHVEIGAGLGFHTGLNRLQSLQM